VWLDGSTEMPGEKVGWYSL